MDKLVKRIDEEEEKEPTHIDDFIAYGSQRSKGIPKNEKYARWMLDHFRRGATQRWDFDEFMKGKKLFCMYKGKKYRVTGASRLGDVWLAKDFKRDSGYDHRVMVDDCSEWTK